MSEAGVKARIAVLLDHFHLTIADVASLTDRQINEFFCHKRDRYGAIKMPVELPDVENTPKTYEEELASLETVISAFRIPQDKAHKARAALAEKFDGGK